MSATPSPTARRKLRYAMVGGGRDAFIGAVHRHAIALDGAVQGNGVVDALESDDAEAGIAGLRWLGLHDAAELLAISPRVMNYKIKTLGIDYARGRRPMVESMAS